MDNLKRENIIKYFKYNSIEFTHERKILCDEFCSLKEFKTSWIKDMSKKHKISLITIYTFKNHMIDAKILKPPSDFYFNTNQEEIESVLKSEPLIKDVPFQLKVESINLIHKPL